MPVYEKELKEDFTEEEFYSFVDYCLKNNIKDCALSFTQFDKALAFVEKGLEDLEVQSFSHDEFVVTKELSDASV
jgi:hypothetical protein